MSKSFPISLAALILSAAPAIAQVATTQTCDGKDPVGYLGISGIDCNCTISSPGSRRQWYFRTEPKITSLEMDSPAGKLLRTGDVITHVNGKLITTADGARELSQINPGEAVVLTVRRNGQSLKYAITAQSVCPKDTRLLGIYAPSLPQGAPPAPGAVAGAARAWTGVTPPPSGFVYGVAPKIPYRSAPRASFGMGLSCSNCSIKVRERDNTTAMSFSQPPEVYSIEKGGPADKAGIRRGDVITHINGNEMTSDEGGKLFANAKPGQRVAFTVQRGAERKTFTLVAAQRSTPSPQLAQSSASLEKARAALTELQREQAEQIRRMQTDLRGSQRAEEEKLRELQREMLREEQEHRRKLSELSKELMGVHNRMRAAMADSARGACLAPTPAPPGAMTLSRTLRYTGTIGGTEIEVRGSYPVSVTESGGEIEITTGGTVVKLKSGNK
jgi:hypothetical protein